MDSRIERVVKLLFDVDLSRVDVKASEVSVANCLSAGLAPLPRSRVGPNTGIDGSVRNTDDQRLIPAADGLAPLNLGIEFKLYRDRGQGAGEMDRGLGQCIAYAETYQAVMLFVVFMGPPREPIPRHWLDRSAPLRVGHDERAVPVYLVVRPRDWNEPWARAFTR